jgi:hypoxanthine-DNA glycosylase
MGELFGAGPEQDYVERQARLTRAGIAVWDVLASSVRPGSMDASIDIASAAPNDFRSLLAAEPEIRLVCFNGQAAARLFDRLVAPKLENGSNKLETRTLPSTSPAFAAMSFDQKLRHWDIVAAAASKKGG